VATGAHHMEDTSPQAVAEKAAKDPKAAKDLKDDAAAATKSFPDHFSREGDDQMDFEGVIFSSSPVLDLSQRGLRHLGKFFKIPNLQVSPDAGRVRMHACLQPAAESALALCSSCSER
jgi:hypothetical protein